MHTIEIYIITTVCNYLMFIIHIIINTFLQLLLLLSYLYRNLYVYDQQKSQNQCI